MVYRTLLTKNMIPLLLLLHLILIKTACAFVPRARHRRNPALARPQLRASANYDDIANNDNSIHRQDEMLWGMTRFFGDDMVDSKTRRFYYTCRPIEEECQHFHFPIRDLAAAWDASKALEFSERIRGEGVEKEGNVLRVQRRLADAVKCTLSVYHSNLVPIDDAGAGLYLSEKFLSEPPTIAHSALLLLGTCDSLRLSMLEQGEDLKSMIDGLTRGILSMQMKNGAFGIKFGNNDDDNYLRGIEFYPGEAMLSLMSVHELSGVSGISGVPKIVDESTRRAILASVERAFGFYSNHYRTEDVDVNFNIWQVLAFAKYHDALRRDQMSTAKEKVKKYVLDMCREICESRSWRHQLARGRSFYVNLETVEIACGLDALAEGIRIARDEEGDDLSDLVKLFEMHATNALYFLEWAQGQVSEGLGEGGLGYGGTQVFEQRLDVTGHAISALVKLRKIAVLLP